MEPAEIGWTCSSGGWVDRSWRIKTTVVAAVLSAATFAVTSITAAGQPFSYESSSKQDETDSATVVFDCSGVFVVVGYFGLL